MHLNFRHRLQEAEKQILHHHTIYRLQLEELKGSPVYRPHFLMLYMKDMFEVWQTQHLFKLIDEKKGLLMHENDGLIFTVD